MFPRSTRTTFLTRRLDPRFDPAIVRLQSIVYFEGNVFILFIPAMQPTRPCELLFLTVSNDSIPYELLYGLI